MQGNANQGGEKDTGNAERDRRLRWLREKGGEKGEKHRALAVWPRRGLKG